MNYCGRAPEDQGQAVARAVAAHRAALLTDTLDRARSVLHY